jgi:hypothetical protein
VTSGETDTIEGWFAYGAALNEGRGLFSGDREFGEWLAENVLSQVAIAVLYALLGRHEKPYLFSYFCSMIQK